MPDHALLPAFGASAKAQELLLTAYDPLDRGPSPRGERTQVKLGRYEIVRELGKGAMGIVYLAKDPLIGRLVALKTIRPAAHIDDDETKEFQQRFIREAQAAGILNHPSIVTVHDIGQDEESGMTFIAMEYVEGQNIKEILAQGRALTFDQIGDIIAQVAEALDFAHSKGIVHRDVKPANIILLDGGRAKITDFGIAKIASGTANLTTTGQFLGTPNYMAPEQIKGAPVDGRTDIFSLGICLYECLTRRKPFGGDSLTSISYKIVHEPFPPLHEINPQIPDGYEDVVALALAKEPAKRYQRGREFAIALRAVVRGERPTRPHEPLLEEATIITKGDRERVPTIEVPFPDGPSSRSGAAVAAHPSAIPVARGSSDTLDRLRRTVDGVRAMPLWRRLVPPAIFFGVIALLAVGLVGAVVSIRAKRPSIPDVDLRAETRATRERQLRTQGNELLRQGKVGDAYDKYMELSKLAPDSPTVTAIVHKLASIRQQDEISKQQLAEAKQKFNEGVALYNNKQYSQAAIAFEESFHLNPASDATVNYLKLAQEMDQLTKQQRAMMGAQPRMIGGPVPQASGAPVATATAPRGTAAQFTTFFNSPVNDGYIMVKVGGEVVAHENLFEEKGRGLFHRKTPRLVNVTKLIAPKNADAEVWVIIPSMGIKEHRAFHQNILPASNHRLQVSFDPQTRRFDYQLN
jgi:serine/threonine protein kinase/outer membrane protein assembly factor BamD (BamD/ComL family)